MSEQKIEVQGYFEYTPIDVDVLDDERLTPIEKVTFAQLRRFASNRTLQCYPSIKTLAKVVNCSDRAVRSAIKKLAELGLIVCTERFEKGGRQTTTLYTVIGHRAECYRSKKEGEHSVPPCTSCTDGGAPDSYRTTTSMNIYNTLTGENEFPDVHAEKKSGSEQAQNDSQPLTEPDKAKNPEEVCSVDDVPEAMKTTAELLLLKTGRKKLTWEEISALRELDRTQLPSRVQKEIDRIIQRFNKHKRRLSELNFVYVAGCLRNQPTRGTAKKSKTENIALKNANQELMPRTDNEPEKLARIAELEAKFDEEGRRK